MHDHWFALTAAAFGKIVFVKKTTMCYRQHQKNFYGAECYGWKYCRNRIAGGIDAIRQRQRQNIRQGKIFFELHQTQLSPIQYDLLNGFAMLNEAGFIRRRSLIIKHRLWKNGFLRNFALFMLV